MRSWLLASVMCFAAVARAGSVLDAPPFSAPPAELVAAAKAAPPGGDVYVIGQSGEVTLESGREVRRERSIFVVRTQAGAAQTTEIDTTYVPPGDHAPVLRARVIDPSGQVHELDSNAVSDALDTRKPGSERHRVVARLPKLEIGSVVETEIADDDETIWRSGTAGEVIFDRLAPVAETRIAISVPAGTHVKLGEHGLPPGVHARHSIANGHETWAYALTNQPARPIEPGEPDDIASRAAVTYSTIASWNALARELHAAIEQRIAAGPVAWPSGVAKAPTLETARAVIAWVRAHAPVATGRMWVGGRSFPPATPADTVAHGGGDELSIATLAIALLRQASLRADVALVGVAPGAESDPSTPGVLAFDHALVRVRIGNADVWIDAADPYAAVGQLVAYQHGSHALLLTEDASGVITMPGAAVADNAIREVHTYELAEEGPAKLTVVRRETGDLAAYARALVADRAPDKLRDDFGEYVSERFHGELTSLTSSPADDVEHPFERTIVVDRVKRAMADGDQLWIGLLPAGVIDELPSELRGTATARVHPYRFATPYSHEIENRLAVPDGYDLPSPQPDRTRALGALRIVEHQRVEGRTWIVTYRLEPTKPVLAPAEVDATRSAVAAWLREPAEVLTIEGTVHALHERHEDAKALAEAMRLAKLHPNEAFHHEQLAGLAIQLGVGALARREAALATRLEPKRAQAWFVLGWVLDHDSFGRDHQFDADRAAARAAVETAHKLDPNHQGVSQELAYLLETDARGLRVSRGADLRTAIALRRGVAASSPSADSAVALAHALLWDGQPAEAEAVLSAAPRSDDGQALLVAAIALGTAGPDAALRQADALASGDAREKLLVSAGAIAFTHRTYHVARRLIGSFGGKGDAEWLDGMLVHATRFDTPFKPTKAPSSVAVELALEALHRDRPRVAFWDADTATEYLAHPVWTELDRFPAADDLVRSMSPVVQGDGPVWRVESRVAYLHEVAYLAADRGVPKYVGGAENLRGVGRHALRLLGRRDDAAAKQLLDWAAADGKPRALANAWGPSAPTDHAQMLVAAALLAGPSDPADVVPILEACNASGAGVQAVCDHVLIDTLEVAWRWPEVLDRAVDAEARSPDDIYVRAAHVAALRHLGRFDEAEAVVTAAAARGASDPIFIEAHIRLELERGKLADAFALAEGLMKRPRPTAMQLNLAAWFGLYAATGFGGVNLGELETAARQAVAGAPKNGGIRNTLALVEIEQGSLAAGFTDELEAMKLRGDAPPDAADWYVMGRYYEQLGLRDDAIAAYRNVKPPAHPDLGAALSSTFAAIRLAALGVKP